MLTTAIFDHLFIKSNISATDRLVVVKFHRNIANISFSIQKVIWTCIGGPFFLGHGLYHEVSVSRGTKHIFLTYALPLLNTFCCRYMNFRQYYSVNYCFIHYYSQLSTKLGVIFTTFCFWSVYLPAFPLQCLTNLQTQMKYTRTLRLLTVIAHVYMWSQQFNYGSIYRQQNNAFRQHNKQYSHNIFTC